MLTIGVAARNEEATLAQCLRSIEEALAELGSAAEVIVAVNGSTDRTWEIASGFAAGCRYRVISSEPGLVEAQRAIAAAAVSTDYVVFVDADCLLDRHCLRRLAEVMSDPAVQATWATKTLAGPSSPGFWGTTLNFGDYHRDVILRGHYLVGQAFAIRRHEIPLGSTVGLRSNLVTYLQLDRGPLVDDSYLSRSLIARFGPESLRPAPEAVVYSHSMRTLRDLWRAQRRKVYEIERLNLLFPDLRSIRGKFFGRRSDASAYARLARVERLQCRVYQRLYSGLWRLAQRQLAANLWLLRRGARLRPCDIWPVVEGTKKPFEDAR